MMCAIHKAKCWLNLTAKSHDISAQREPPPPQSISESNRHQLATPWYLRKSTPTSLLAEEITVLSSFMTQSSWSSCRNREQYPQLKLRGSEQSQGGCGMLFWLVEHVHDTDLAIRYLQELSTGRRRKSNIATFSDVLLALLRRLYWQLYPGCAT